MPRSNSLPKSEQVSLSDLLLASMPLDGSAVNAKTLRKAFEASLAARGIKGKEKDFEITLTALCADGALVNESGKGGIRLAHSEAGTGGDLVDDVEGFSLQAEVASATVSSSANAAARKTASPSKAKPVTARTAKDGAAQIISYRHSDKRKNNPEVGMVTPVTDPEEGKTRWAYDPHIDPALQFDSQRSRIENLIDDALASGDAKQMQAALEELRRQQSPYLNWSGKAERTSFDVDTVSLHVHERIDPASILAAVRKAMKGDGKSKGAEKALQPGLFDAPFENLPLRDAIDFYRHERGWANRMIAGDSLLVMNSLLQKESMAGRVQMIYIDPPYGIKYGSNFQPFVGKRDVKDRTDADLTQEPEMIKAFRDTWELGIHSYLTYLRDRLVLAKELLHQSGSIFVQISDENVHLTRNLLDEIFGTDNFCSQIVYQKAPYATSTLLPPIFDTVLWYAKKKDAVKYRHLYVDRSKEDIVSTYKYKDAGVSETDGTPRAFSSVSLISAGPASTKQTINHRGRDYDPAENSHWKTTVSGIYRAGKAGRLFQAANSLRFKSLPSDFPVATRHNIWTDTITGSFTDQKVYVVQTNPKIIERCTLMVTDPGDIVLDPTCGSGTTAFVAEKWGRRWITCDTSRVAVTLAKQRLMTASFDYFELKYPNEGLKGGFIYKTVPHVTLKSIANNPEIDAIYERMHPAIETALGELNKSLKSQPPQDVFLVAEGGRKGQKMDLRKDALLEWEVPFEFPQGWPAIAHAAFNAFHAARLSMQKQMDDSIASHADHETLYDQPAIADNKLRITGPFTVEAVPFPSVKSLDEAEGPQEADASIARTGESGRQHQWRDELLKTGIRGKGGQMLKFADLEALPIDADIRHLHASGHLESGERVVVSFGPEHGALEQRQVTNALNEAGNLFPLPKMIVFCAFAFDPEAAKDIDAMKGITALKAQMNTDLLTEDLKKARTSNQSFWLMGQPEVERRKRKDGLYEVEVHGFDYFDTVKGELVSGGKSKIAMWSLDTDYDDRSLFPRQVFFPMAGKGEGWDKLKKNIRAELDEALLPAFHGTVSLPFEAGDNRKIAVKIVDDRGIESLKVITLD